MPKQVLQQLEFAGRQLDRAAAARDLAGDQIHIEIADAFIAYDQTAGVYRVQVGSFSTRSRADDFAAEMRARGYQTFVVQ